MAIHKAREQSLKLASRAGVLIPSTLPLLESNLHARSQEEIENQLLCVHALAAAAYGFDRIKSLAWIHQQCLDGLLTDAGRRFLEQGEGDPIPFQLQVESMWVLAWALCLVPQLDFWKECDDSFVAMLPNLKTGENSTNLREKAHVRPITELIYACDFAYCLHWAIRQAELEGKQPPAKLKPCDVVERRRALEWLLSDKAWDAVSLDT